jgi:hypothetical protein
MACSRIPASAIIMAGQSLVARLCHAEHTPRRVGSDRISRRYTVAASFAVGQAVEQSRWCPADSAVAWIGARRGERDYGACLLEDARRRSSREAHFPMPGVIAERDW